VEKQKIKLLLPLLLRLNLLVGQGKATYVLFLVKPKRENLNRKIKEVGRILIYHQFISEGIKN
jgi:hypothetical protein